MSVLRLSKPTLFILRRLEYIQTIMMMEESVQHVVMTAIQEVNRRRYLRTLTSVSAAYSELFPTVCVCFCS